MICKDLNIRDCPQCNEKRPSLCWIETYRETLSRMSVEEVKWFFLDAHRYWAHMDDKSIKCSFYMEQSIRVHYPELINTIEKLKVLL